MAETSGTPRATLNTGNVATNVNQLNPPRIFMQPVLGSDPNNPRVKPKMSQVRRVSTKKRPHTVDAVVRGRKQ